MEIEKHEFNNESYQVCSTTIMLCEMYMKYLVLNGDWCLLLGILFINVYMFKCISSNLQGPMQVYYVKGMYITHSVERDADFCFD